MKAQDLKNSILQYAIQGKLVPQDPNDEPASVLLEKIKAEKLELIKQGKIKKDKQESYIFKGEDNKYYEKIGKEVKDITDEIPFEIPDSWEWVRFGKIVINYDSKRKPVAKSDRDKLRKIYDYYGATGVIDKVENYLFDGIYLMIGEDGGNFYTQRDNSFIANGKFWANNHVHIVSPILLNIKYLKYCLDSTNFPAKGLITGIAVPKLNQDNLNSILIPLPPLKEQKRIVAKIEELEPFIKEYNKAEIELTTLNKNFPEQIKKSILQYAIQGKLVPQDPNDEPASVLLEKIKAEKLELIKQGKIKKDKQESYIFKGEDNKYYEKIGKEVKDITDEIPFEIPDSWELIRLNNVTINIPTKSYQILQSEIIKHGCYPVVSQSQQLVEGYSNEEKKLYKHDTPVLLFGDHTKCLKILEFNFIIGADGTKIIKPYQVNTKYLYYSLKYFIINMKNRGYSRHFQFIKNKVIPLPPLSEQKRIVAKIEELEAVMEKYEK